MQITAFERRGDYFYRVTFSRDGESVEKTVQLSGAMDKCLRNDDERLSAWVYTIQKAAREADRDIAFKQHGRAFRDHCEYKSNFWQMMSPEELVKLLKDSDELVAG